MFSPNQIYDYLRYYCHTGEKNSQVRNFIINGSKNLANLTQADSPHTNSNISGTNINHLQESRGCLDMYDQEPVDIHAFYNDSYDKCMQGDPDEIRLKFNTYDFVFSKSMSVYTPIICHSEKNSIDVDAYAENFYTPVHFFSNGNLSRYWFSQYELLFKNNSATKPKRFGAYIRATSDTRKYRKHLLNFLKTDEIKKNTFCPSFNENNDVPSTASASLVWNDHNKFDIHIVPETIFNTNKIHLTEKIFKPIVMFQSFIVLGGAGSLHYLKDYGFKTFGSIWDESYDNIRDPNERLRAIEDLIKKINSLSEDKYKDLINKTHSIIEFNRTHFYSATFKNKILNELHSNLEQAFNTQNENFYKMPGGTLFYYYDMFFKLNNNRHPNVYDGPRLNKALEYIFSISEEVGNLTVNKYKHLL